MNTGHNIPHIYVAFLIVFDMIPCTQSLLFQFLLLELVRCDQIKLPFLIGLSLNH